MKAKMKATAQLLTVVVAVGVCVPTASAAVSVTLGDLIADQGSILSGDKLFEHFTYVGTGDMPGAGDIVVQPFTDANNNFGIRLVSSFLDYPGNGPSDAKVTFRVTPTDPDYRISGAALQGNTSIIKSGIVSATQTIAGIPGQLQIFDQVPGGTDLLDSKTFGSLFAELDVELLLSADAGEEEENDSASASFIDQTFAQSVVPEPASLAVWCGMLLLIGVVPYAYRRVVPAISSK